MKNQNRFAAALWELDWIMRNIHRYDSWSHAIRVMGRIVNRHLRNYYIGRLRELRTERVKKICSYRRVETNS